MNKIIFQGGIEHKKSLAGVSTNEPVEVFTFLSDILHAIRGFPLPYPPVCFFLMSPHCDNNLFLEGIIVKKKEWKFAEDVATEREINRKERT